jgi:hypothetical protein
LLVLVAIIRVRFMPENNASRGKVEIAAVYFPAFYVVVAVTLYAILTSYPPMYWPRHSTNDWKVFLDVSFALFFPGVNMVLYARAIPGSNAYPILRNRILRLAGRENEAEDPSPTTLPPEVATD